MRWPRSVPMCCLALSVFSASVFSQASSSTATPLPEPTPNWTTLDELLTRLESEATDLSASSETLKVSLEEARSRLIELSARLDESRTQASGLSDSLRLSALSLETFAESLKAEERRRGLELWLWRGGTAAGIILAMLALIR